MKETFDKSVSLCRGGSVPLSVKGKLAPSMEQEMDVVPPEMVKSRRSMSIQSICDPLASSTSTISDHDSEATLAVNDPMSLDGGDLPKLDTLSPSEEQAVRALEDLRAGILLLRNTCN